MRAIVAALFCAGSFGASADAATFYYVSGVYEFSNYESGVVPTFTTGYLDIDESKLPAGQSLAGLRVDQEWTDIGDGYWRFWPEYAKFSFQNQRGTLTDQDQMPWSSNYFQIGDSGDVSDWSIGRFAWNEGSWRSNSRAGADSYITTFGGEFFPNDPEEEREVMDQRIGDFLEALGYKRGTEEFDRVRAEHQWYDGFSSGNGALWTSDPLYYALLVEERTRQAIATPPSNFYAIESRPAPVPLPAAAWLLIGGVAALGGLGMRRQARM